MTKTERAELRAIIDLLFDATGNGFTEGMVRLCRLAEMTWPAGEALLKGGSSVEVGKVLDGPDRPFGRPASTGEEGQG